MADEMCCVLLVTPSLGQEGNMTLLSPAVRRPVSVLALCLLSGVSPAVYSLSVGRGRCP